MAKNKCYLCNTEPADSWHVSATGKETVCMKCMTKYRSSLSKQEKKRDVIIVWRDGRVGITDLSPARSHP